MSDDFDDDDDNVTHVDFAPTVPPPADPEKPKRKRAMIPVIKPSTIDPATLQKPDQRSTAAVNMRIAGTPFVEIARTLGYSSAKAAETAIVSALANMYPVEAAENMRQLEALRAEALFSQAITMAQASHFVDVEDETILIANTEQARWHDQALKALQLHAMITGARAPARLEVAASTQELHAMVNAILAAQGGETVVEADIFSMDEIPQLEEGQEWAEEVGDGESPTS